MYALLVAILLTGIIMSIFEESLSLFVWTVMLVSGMYYGWFILGPAIVNTIKALP